jgi:hypothetical protein
MNSLTESVIEHTLISIEINIIINEPTTRNNVNRGVPLTKNKNSGNGKH